ncbi:MAG: hypothetical protein ACREQM_06825 [Candidatus Dormibacteraceae bacterium]
MLGWLEQVLHTGIVTIRYPRRPEPQAPGVRNRLVLPAAGVPPEAAARAAAACPTGALAHRDGQLRFDLGLCVQCGRCIAAAPASGIAFAPDYEVAVRERQDLVEEVPA